MVIMASGIARGRVRTTAAATTTVESRNMAAMLQIMGWQRHAALVYRVLYGFITCRAKLLNADWLRQRAFFLSQEGTSGNQEGMIT